MKFTPSAGYSRYVSLMKVFLPVGIVFSIGMAIGWQHIFKSEEQDLVMVDVSHPEIKENRMIHPTYKSTDQKGQPYQVSADWAKQQTDAMTDLVNPKGSLTDADGNTFNVSAKDGHYDKEAKTLDLEGDVTLISEDGYKVTTQKAHVSIDDNRIEGNDYVEGAGPSGELMGTDGFIVENRSGGKKVITLKGRSQVTIVKVALKDSEKAHD